MTYVPYSWISRPDKCCTPHVAQTALGYFFFLNLNQEFSKNSTKSKIICWHNYLLLTDLHGVCVPPPQKKSHPRSLLSFWITSQILFYSLSVSMWHLYSLQIIPLPHRGKHFKVKIKIALYFFFITAILLSDVLFCPLFVDCGRIIWIWKANQLKNKNLLQAHKYS